MDWKQLIQWSLRRWYVYLACVVVCCLIAGVCYLYKAPVYEVSASLMLRQANDKKRTMQEDLMNMMGFGGEKKTGDEVEVLTSRSLMSQVAEKLNLSYTYYKKGKRYMQCQYPERDFTLILPDTLQRKTDIYVKVKADGEWKVKIKLSRFSSPSYTLADPHQSLSTEIGNIRFVFDRPVPEGQYVVHYEPKIWAVRNTSEKISVARLAKESNVIQISSLTTAPNRTEDIINCLLDFYHQEATDDKNRLAVQTSRFLDERLSVLAAELTEAENDLETYKREHRISDIDRAAEAYRSQSDQYQRKVAQMDAEAKVLDFIGQQVQLPENENSVLPSNLGVSDAALQDIIQQYNALILKRGKLLQTASEDNPTVLQLSEQITRTRANIVSGIDKAKQSLSLLRESETMLQQQYDSRLGAMPEQEKRYLEMQRVCQTKEKQYVYLVQQRESNAMLLASDAVPAKIIDRAQRNPLPVGPKLNLYLLVAFIFGMILPLFIYVVGVVRREYMFTF